MKNGLVLEGGAMRGLFTAGVLDALMEEKITFDGAMGVSAGAAFGCNFKSGQKGRALRYNARYCADRRYCGVWSLLTTGDLFGAEFCYHTLPEKLDPFDWETYEKNPMPFWAVCTSLQDGKARAFSCEGERNRVLEIFRASASMPLVSRAVTLDGKEYLDGGISCAIPLAMMEKKGFEKNLVILTQPRAYRKTPAGAIGWIRLRYGKNSPLARCMEHRHEMYNSQRAYVFRREKEGKAFVLAPPSPLPVNHRTRDPERLREVWRAGYREGKKNIENIRKFFKDEAF